ncbi:MAG: hypothetical protein ABJB93_09370 [Gaiellales bacterium]
MARRRPWLIPTAAGAGALALFIAGVLTWRMMPGIPGCSPNTLCPAVVPADRLHPLRAELLWAASAAFALIAVGASLRQWRRPGAARPVSG